MPTSAASTSCACSRATLGSDSQLLNVRTQHRERIGQLLDVQGRDHKLVTQLGPGEIGAVPKLKDVMTGDLLVDRELSADPADLPEPVVAVAVDPKSKGDEDKMATALRRLSEEDPTLRVARDERTGELIVSGLSQMHVDVTVDRVRRRFGVEMITHPPRVPYLEAIKSRARAHARYKKQTGGRGQFGGLPHRGRAARPARGLRVHRQDRRRRHPAGIPARRRQGHPGGDGAR